MAFAAAASTSSHAASRRRRGADLAALRRAAQKRYATGISALVSTTYFLFYTAVVLFVLSISRHESMTRFLAAPASAHLAFIYLAVVGSVLAWTIYLWLLQRLDLSVLSTLGLVQPLLALALDLALRETQLQPAATSAQHWC